MPRRALILSCVIHGAFLALVGWSSFFIVNRPERAATVVSISLAPGDSALVVEDPPTAVIPEFSPQPAEPNFTPPPPTIDPIPLPVTTVDATLPSIPTVSEMPHGMPSVSPPKKEHAARSSAGARGISNAGAASALAGAVSGGDYIPPTLILHSKPPYPEQARAQRQEGVVLLHVSVDANGRVTGASIQQSCGFLALDHAAIEAVRTWRFNPARRADRAVPAAVEIPIRFTLSA